MICIKKKQNKDKKAVLFLFFILNVLMNKNNFGGPSNKVMDQITKEAKLGCGNIPVDNLQYITKIASNLTLMGQKCLPYDSRSCPGAAAKSILNNK